MKIPQYLLAHKDIQDWLLAHNVKDFSIDKEPGRDNTIVNIHGNLDLSAFSIIQLPFKLGHVEGQLLVNHTMLRTKKSIEHWLQEQKIKNYTLVANEKYGYVIDVPDSIDLSLGQFLHIPVKFNHIQNDFLVYKNCLTNLEFAPMSVGGRFDISNNRLTSLKGSPQNVNGFRASHNDLTNLEGGPKVVKGGDYDCSYTNLKSLKGAPRSLSESFDCSGNQLTSLRYAPVSAHTFDCSINLLKNLEYISKNLTGDLNIDKNPISSLAFMPKKYSMIYSFDYYTGVDNKQLCRYSSQKEALKLHETDKIKMEKEKLSEHLNQFVQKSAHLSKRKSGASILVDTMKTRRKIHKV